MAHKEQREFCEWVKETHPQYFNNRTVVEIGSRDINGTIRDLFFKCRYTGIDLSEGNGVDEVGRAHRVLEKLERQFDVMVSCESLEHDEFWRVTLWSMYHYLKPGGLLLVTAAGNGRREHGTHNHTPQDSPDTPDYYENVSNEMLSSVLKPEMFATYFVRQDQRNFDMQFYGIKN